MAICSISGCEKSHRARGLCSTHYNRQYQPDRHRKDAATCDRCGVPCAKARTSRYIGRYCSYACRESARRDHLLPIHVGSVPPRCEVPPEHPCRQASQRRTEWWKLLIAGDCAWCGEYFVALATDRERASRYCSKGCRNYANRRRFTVPPQVRLAIYERDNWTCQLCSEPVDPDLPSSDTWGATLDHIECQSWTLFPDHSPQNLRLTHRWCNSVRGDETYYTPDVLAA